MKEATENRDVAFLQELAKKQIEAGAGKTTLIIRLAKKALAKKLKAAVIVNEIIAIYEDRSIFKTCRLTIVDPLRFPILMEVLTPLITSQIQSAEWVLINKEDVASSKDMRNARQTVSHLNPGARIICTSVKQTLDLTGRPWTDHVTMESVEHGHIQRMR